nr:DUF3231 family protein [Piscibacillus salipiscarius]
MNEHKENLKEHQQNRKLSASELGDLFTNYVGDTLYCCMFDHQLTVIKDKQIKELLNKGLEISQNHITKLENLFNQEVFRFPLALESKT